jgi:hypothetical protein
MSDNEQRRLARDLDLPEEERRVLREECTTKRQRNCRARQLFEAGWTLRAIGEAYDPPFRRSTVRYWVEQGGLSERINVPIPIPGIKPRGYQRKKPRSPGISEADAKRLAKLAPKARLYRSGMPNSSGPAIANEEFSELARSLFAQNVTIAELARASGVTFRAMARRLGR